MVRPRRALTHPTPMVRLAICALFLLTGCELTPPPPSTLTASAAPAERPSDAPAGMTFIQITGDAARLMDDIPRAIKRCLWGTLHVTAPPPPAPADPIAAALRSPVAVTPTAAQPIRAAAMLPDDRPAEMLVWRVDEKTVAAGIRVGRFGDHEEERRFLRALTDVLAGPALFKHRDTFELPEDWPARSR